MCRWEDRELTRYVVSVPWARKGREGMDQLDNVTDFWLFRTHPSIIDLFFVHILAIHHTKKKKNPARYTRLRVLKHDKDRDGPSHGDECTSCT